MKSFAVAAERHGRRSKDFKRLLAEARAGQVCDGCGRVIHGQAVYGLDGLTFCNQKCLTDTALLIVGVRK